MLPCLGRKEENHTAVFSHFKTSVYSQTGHTKHVHYSDIFLAAATSLANGEKELKCEWKINVISGRHRSLSFYIKTKKFESI